MRFQEKGRREPAAILEPKYSSSVTNKATSQIIERRGKRLAADCTRESSLLYDHHQCIYSYAFKYGRWARGMQPPAVNSHPPPPCHKNRNKWSRKVGKCHPKDRDPDETARRMLWRYHLYVAGGSAVSSRRDRSLTTIRVTLPLEKVCSTKQPRRGLAQRR